MAKTKRTAKAAATKATTATETDAGMNVQSGQEPGLTPAQERERLNEQFAKADAKGQAAIIDETQVGLQVRGY